jgi:phage/plasmid-like protein (TIGR03299 family)
MVPQIFKRSLAVSDVETVEATEVFNQYNWDVKEAPVFRPDGKLISGYKTIERSDNGHILNMCKDSYTPVTNEQFCEFVENLSKITGYQIENFSEFQQGAKVLAFIKAPEFSINGHSFDNYLAVGNSHDSSKAFFVANTNTMIRCQNQFSLAVNGLKAFHTSNNQAQIKQIERSFNLWSTQQKVLQNNYDLLSNNNVSEQRAEKFIKHIFDLPEELSFEDAEKELSSRKMNQIGELVNCIEIESKDLGNTDFALFNGVTRWTTHVRKQKDKTFGNLFGTNATLNNKALEFVLN